MVPWQPQHASVCFSPGILKLTLPGTTFLECAKTDPPSNTLFPNVNPVRVGMSTMEFYLPLILRLFEASPEGFLSWLVGVCVVIGTGLKQSIGYLAIWTKHFRWLPYCCPIYLSYPVIRIDSINLGSGPSISGEYTSAFLSQVFSELDKQNRFNLSQARFLKDRANWANSESWAAHSGLVMG